MALKARWPGSRFLGIGGARMKGQGVELLADLDGLAVMGVAEVLPRLPFLHRLRRQLISLLDSGDIDLVIPVDYAGFNLRIARAAHRRKVPVLYYIAPKIWAWGAGRARKLAAYTNRLALILPFEAEALVRAGANATFVGHPLLETPALEPDRPAFCRRWHLDLQRPILALLPGSRPQELARHLALFLEAGHLVQDWGGEGPLALLHHANGFCSALWAGVAERLRGRFRVIAMDARGQGDSSQPPPGEPCTWEGLCDDLEEAHFEALAASPRPGSGIVVPFERRKTAEPPVGQGVHVERTTRFEPATLTLARYADLFR